MGSSCWLELDYDIWAKRSKWMSEKKSLWKLEHQCMEQPHNEKSVFKKETEESCIFIEGKGGNLLGHIPMGDVLGVQPPFILNSQPHVALFLSPVSEVLGRYSFFQTTYQTFPLEHVSSISPKIRSSGCLGSAVDLCGPICPITLKLTESNRVQV